MSLHQSVAQSNVTPFLISATMKWCELCNEVLIKKRILMKYSCFIVPEYPLNQLEL